ncbi:hypothetical protein U737_08725 [Methylomonas sp. LW13]|uniref:hypothetical protein n=1 Tax=unclassified Methylomonas TaxID=2608980 RepID=UPI00051B1924|nr:hypothetical protein [Methylomonas sp. LW13]QBC26983.1 hypothetical protein U737_08725 [Methylomonas sp. LW13]
MTFGYSINAPPNVGSILCAHLIGLAGAAYAWHKGYIGPKQETEQAAQIEEKAAPAKVDAPAPAAAPAKPAEPAK